MPKNIDPGQRAQKKDARKGAAFFALVQLAMALLLLWGRSQLAGLEGLDWLRLLLLILAVGDLVTIPAVDVYKRQALGRRVELTVEDNGIGIPAHELPRIFDRGFTGSNGRSRGGSTGMGLYLARRLAAALEIELRAASEEGKGCLLYTSG